MHPFIPFSSYNKHFVRWGCVSYFTDWSSSVMFPTCSEHVSNWQHIWDWRYAGIQCRYEELDSDSFNTASQLSLVSREVMFQSCCNRWNLHMHKYAGKLKVTDTLRNTRHRETLGTVHLRLCSATVKLLWISQYFWPQLTHSAKYSESFRGFLYIACGCGTHKCPT